MNMNATTERTLPEKILLAAFQLEEQGKSPFTAEMLTVNAWLQHPRTFGLRGFHEQHPDSNKVLTTLMGEKGLARKGWLVKVGQKLYALTNKGRQIVRRFLDRGESPSLPQGAVELGASLASFLQRQLDSVALHKYRQECRQDWTFADACRFWGLTESHCGKAVDSQLDRTQRQISELARRIGLGEAILANGRSVTVDDVALLEEVHEHLQERFVRHLALLRHRRVER
jgi:hypothetical protein